MQAEISFMPHVDGTSSDSLLNFILSILLKKWLSYVWVVTLFFLVIDGKVALDCILNGCCNISAPFYIQVLYLKN